MEDTMLKLVQAVSELTTKVDAIQEDIKGMPMLLQKHDTRLDQIDISLQRGNQKFEKIDNKFDKLDERLDKLEQADGEKAKSTLRTICSYGLTALLGAIVANIPTIINSLAK